MARHPFVAQADEGPRFGILLTGARGLQSPNGPDHGWLIHEDPLAEILRAASIAEEAGLDGLFVPETPRLFPDPAVTLAALAVTTRRLFIGSLVIVPAFRHPALLARQLIDIDRLSQGRLVAGFGVGESGRQYATVAARWGSANERQEALTESLELMAGLWNGEAASYHGQYWQSDDMRVAQGSVQQPRPPILIAGSGDGTLAQVVRHGDICNLFGGPDSVDERFARLFALCDESGRPRDEILRSIYDFPILARTEERAQEKMRRFLAPEVIERRGSLGLLVATTPAKAIEHYKRLAEKGVQLFASNLADTSDRETLTLLAEEVIPKVKA